MSYSIQHLKETAEIVARINPDDCEQCAQELVGVRTRGGRLFILGAGGSAANASHAVNDFRKIAGIECYAPTDNVSELTARTSDGAADSIAVAAEVSRNRRRVIIACFSLAGSCRLGGDGGCSQSALAGVILERCSQWYTTGRGGCTPPAGNCD